MIISVLAGLYACMLIVGGVFLFAGGPDPSPGGMADARSGGLLYLLGAAGVIIAAVFIFRFGRKCFR